MTKDYKRLGKFINILVNKRCRDISIRKRSNYKV